MLKINFLKKINCLLDPFTEMQFILNLVLGKTGLVVLKAKHNIFYLALLFVLYPNKQLLMFAQKWGSGVTTCWKRRDNNVIIGTLEFCHRPEVVSNKV